MHVRQRHAQQLPGDFQFGKIEEIVDQREKIQEIAIRYAHFKNFLFLGRGINYPVALEGALKLKEIAYVNANGYPLGKWSRVASTSMNPQYFDFPHQTSNPRFVVETSDDLCLNCHPTFALP